MVKGSTCQVKGRIITVFPNPRVYLVLLTDDLKSQGTAAVISRKQCVLDGRE